MTRRSAIYNQAAAAMRDCAAAYRDYLEAHYAAAAEATHGQLVTAAGVAAGVTSWDLFTGPGVFLRAQAYATRELQDFWELHPRLTAAAFERAWLHGHTAGTVSVYLSRKQFAERIGVKPDTLSRYTLPEPDAHIGDTRGWLPDTVDAWHAARPRT